MELVLKSQVGDGVCGQSWWSQEQSSRCWWSMEVIGGGESPRAIVKQVQPRVNGDAEARRIWRATSGSDMAMGIGGEKKNEG